MKVQRTIEIAAPPEKVWPYFVEPEKILQWCSTFRKFEYTGSQRSGVGTPFYIEEQAGGRLSKMEFEATEWKENEKIALRMVSGANYTSYVQEWLIEPVPLGSRVTFKEEIGLPYGVLGKLIGLADAKMSETTVVKMEAKLKELVEG